MSSPAPHALLSNPQGDPTLAAIRDVVTIVVAGETMGLPVEQVQSIFHLGEVTPVPLAPKEIIGLVNWRGKVATAISLRRRLGLAVGLPTKNALAVASEQKGEQFALVVDEVGDVFSLQRSDAIAAPSHLDPSRRSLTEVFYRLQDTILPVLDLAAVLDFGELKHLPEATTQV